MKRFLVYCARAMSLFLLLLWFLSGSITGTQTQLSIYRAGNEFDARQPFPVWEKECGNRYFQKEWNGVSARLYTVFNKEYLHLGFLIKDSFLCFTDDYSLDFAGSDHLRLYLKFPETAGMGEELVMFVHPYSKIREPLWYLPGTTWRHASFRLSSYVDTDRYFLSVSIPLSGTGLYPRSGLKLNFNCLVHNIAADGAVHEYWLGGASAEERLTLIFK